MVDAKKVRDMVKNTGKSILSSSQKVQPHKHCRVCHEPIPIKADPRVCKKEECVEQNERDERNQKAMRFWMFIFFGLFVAGFVLPIVFRLV